MCVEIESNKIGTENTKKFNMSNYSIKKLLKVIFKKQRKTCKSTSLESVDNIRNSQVEDLADETADNEANERLEHFSCLDLQDENDTIVPVNFVRTIHGTFFWSTTNPQDVDADLVQSGSCFTSYQEPTLQFLDRWAQA